MRAPLGEWEAVESFRTSLGPAAPGEVGVGDDAAVVVPGGGKGSPLLFATDLVVGGVHVDRAFCTDEDIGWKAIAVNVSDMAAMGGRATHAVVGLVVPAGADVMAVFKGMEAAAATYGTALVGGDLSTGSELVASVAMLGTTDGRPPVLRSGAAAGDTLLLTGPLGRSAAGLEMLRRDRHSAGENVDAHRRPVARQAEGVAAALAGASAMIDVSDGLASDIGHLARASGVGVELELVPVGEGASQAQALGGGEDYELLFAVADPRAVEKAFAEEGLRPPIRIGRCVADPSVRSLAGRPLMAAGYQHRLG